MRLSEETKKVYGKHVRILVVFFVINGVKPLRNVMVSVPRAVKTLDSVTLRCNYDLEGDPLYTVKWYKGHMEIFRYIPKELPNMQAFPLPGVNIDMTKCTPNEIVLRNVQPEVTGRFRCEVSTDAPNFYTKEASGMMYVVDLPATNPILEIEKNTDYLGYTLRANCTTPPSFPPMNITWYINGIKINEVGRKLISLDPTATFSKNRRIPVMTVSYLIKELDDNIFQDGPVKLQCIGTLFDLYRSEDVRYIDENRPHSRSSSVQSISKNASDCRTAAAWRRGFMILVGIYILR